jgi:hypothetical protein
MTLGVLVMLGSSVAFADERGIDHAAWDALLHRYVDAHGAVDYRAWHDEGQHALKAYLERLAETDVSRLAKEEALAFWINAYNACVVQGVLEQYPISSVKDAPGFFEKITYRIGKESLTLNEIEGRGRKLGDWRVHFALVCASSSCPFLRRESYVAGRLDEQLTEQTRRFLVDAQRGVRVEGRTLWLSKIFDWYKRDVLPASELGWLGRLTPETLLPRIEPYLDRHIAQAIRSKRLSISFLDYNWSLNAQHK